MAINLKQGNILEFVNPRHVRHNVVVIPTGTQVRDSRLVALDERVARIYDFYAQQRMGNLPYELALTAGKVVMLHSYSALTMPVGNYDVETLEKSVAEVADKALFYRAYTFYTMPLNGLTWDTQYGIFNRHWSAVPNIWVVSAEALPQLDSRQEIPYVRLEREGAKLLERVKTPEGAYQAGAQLYRLGLSYNAVKRLVGEKGIDDEVWDGFWEAATDDNTAREKASG